METESKKWFYKSYWLVDKQVAHLEIIGDFDDIGMIEFNTHLRDVYLETGEPPVHCIIDASNLTGYPHNISVLRNGTSISVKHPNVGWIILVGFDNPLVKFLASAVVQILGIKFKQVESLEEAQVILSRVDTRLAPPL